MEHFYWQPLSVLLSNRLEGDKQSITLSRALCEAVRATPSFQKYCRQLTSCIIIVMLLCFTIIVQIRGVSKSRTAGATTGRRHRARGRICIRVHHIIIRIIFLQSAVCVFLDKLHSYHVTFFPVLECLHILTKHLPSNHLGSKVCVHSL